MTRLAKRAARLDPRPWARPLLRVALGAAFLSAVASRLGLWGPNAGNTSAAFAGFTAYVAELNPWVPAAFLPALAVLVTVVEGSLGLALVAGFRTRTTSLCAGVLLSLFAAAMTAFTGAKSALDYSVWSAAAGAFLLSAATAPEAAEEGAATSPAPGGVSAGG